MSGDSKKDSNLIGQFGVGFYSSFMVADSVEVTTKKAGEKTSFLSKSDGKTGFTIKEVEKDSYGTEIKLFLNFGPLKLGTKSDFEIIKQNAN